ncbi:MAG: helix-turn-helix transcriptional regulator [Lysobacter sp.]|nr:helix-turn-helix transcriptional regulator [Lysobacter sp.]
MSALRTSVLPTSALPASALPTRIRKARLSARLTQAELARRVGVKRSAVTQWEHPLGTTPSMHHLIQIAIETGTCIEWLATARGPCSTTPGETAGSIPLTNGEAHDPQEDEALLRFRRLPAHKRRIALQILQVLSG